MVLGYVQLKKWCVALQTVALKDAYQKRMKRVRPYGSTLNGNAPCWE